MLPQRILFYYQRVKNSSCAELTYRTRQFLQSSLLRYRFRKGGYHVPVPAIAWADAADLALPTLRWQGDEHTIETIMGGRTFTLNADRTVIRRFEDENRGRFYASVTPSAAVPDIRQAWEPARLQHLALLCEFVRQNPEAPRTSAIKEHIKRTVVDWIQANPFLAGPHYASVLECGLRVPVFLYALKGVESFPDDERYLVLRALYEHAWWIFRRLSLYSSLGNHTIGECVGLVFAGAVFRRTDEGRAWLDRACSLLRRELHHQILPDGGPAEQSFAYHRFVLDLCGLVIEFLEKNSLFDCRDFRAALRRGEEFLAQVSFGDGCLPTIGDSDDGHAVAPGISPLRPEVAAPGQGITQFRHSGYTVIRTGGDVLFLFDHGPLGMAPLYNHGHADALSVILYKDGREMLVDPGTYRYNGAPEFRHYFKGTRAHNTVTVDGCDQAVQETGFIWSRPYRAELLASEEIGGGVLLEALHNGYTRLRHPVWHTRTVQFFDDGIILIRDLFSGEGVHDFEINYHVHPDAVLSERDGWWTIDHGGTKVYLRLLDDDEFECVLGKTEPPHGWYSPAYGIKKESGVLCCRKRGAVESVSFTTALCTDAPMDTAYLDERMRYCD